jgi:hypothetical protein
LQHYYSIGKVFDGDKQHPTSHHIFKQYIPNLLKQSRSRGGLCLQWVSIMVPSTTTPNGANHDGDPEAKESTGLLAAPANSTSSDMEQLLSSSDREDSTASNSRDPDDAELWIEMDAPWPATFERTISLLASPVIKAETVNQLTRSPKPGNTPLAMRRSMVRSNGR